MFRPLVALVVVGSFASTLLAADPAAFAEPLNINVEMSKINAEFAKAQAGIRDRASYDKVLASRNEALGRLAATAEAAKSTDHEALAHLYALLQRNEDAVREARAAIQSKDTDFAAGTDLNLSAEQHAETGRGHCGISQTGRAECCRSRHHSVSQSRNQCRVESGWATFDGGKTCRGRTSGERVASEARQTRNRKGSCGKMRDRARRCSPH